MLPLGTSAVTVGFGFLIALDHPVDLRSSWIIVPIAHSLVAIPFVVRLLVPVLRSIDDRLRDAATVLGASPARVWKEIDLPIVRRAMLVAAGFAFAISLGEFGATLFIARPDRPTMPVAIFRYLSQAGATNFGAAMAMSTILMIITATCHLRHRTVPNSRTRRVLTALDVEGLRVVFGGTAAVDGVDLHVASGEIVTLLGPSGCGKSTMLRAISGLLLPDAGRILLDGVDQAGVAPHRRRLGLMFQEYALFPHRDVRGNVSFGPRMSGDDRSASPSTVREVLALVGLGGLRGPVDRVAVGRRAATCRAGASVGTLATAAHA